MEAAGTVHVRVKPEVQSPVTDAMALAAAAAHLCAVLSAETVAKLPDGEFAAVADLQAVLRRISTQDGYFKPEEQRAYR